MVSSPPNDALARQESYGPVEMDTIMSPGEQPPTLSHIYKNYPGAEYLTARFGFIYDQRRKKRQSEAAAALAKQKRSSNVESLGDGRSVLHTLGLDDDIEPMEPTKHQYDVDTETVIGFLRANGLDKDFKVNIEVNHATLAGHTFDHELAVAVDNGMLGSIDANRGDYQNGWDTDQFPIDNWELTQAMIQIIRNGGLGNGGSNFDAKI